MVAVCLLIAMELQWESESTAVSLSLLASIKTCANKPVSCHFNIRMRDFLEDAALLQKKIGHPCH